VWPLTLALTQEVFAQPTLMHAQQLDDLEGKKKIK
jgi:hypothetical protein